MPASPAIDDLFGHVPQDSPVRGDAEGGFLLEGGRNPFEADYVVPYAEVPEGGHTPETIRAHVMKVMKVVREAETMPFGARELRTYTGMMPYLCEWLKNGEGDALLAEFREHIERLKLAA